MGTRGLTPWFIAFLALLQVVQFMGMLFGEDVALELPHPYADMDGFMATLKSQLASTKPQFNIITKRVDPLINLSRLKKHLKRHMQDGRACVILWLHSLKFKFLSMTLILPLTHPSSSHTHASPHTCLAFILPYIYIIRISRARVQSHTQKHVRWCIRIVPLVIFYK